jgi:hypothetical protein
VHSIAYDPAGNVKAYIAANGGTCVTIRDGKVLGCSPSALPEKDPEAIAKRFEHLTLPCHPGRQYLAVASACAELGDGSILVGTKDGMAALVRGDKVFNLGSIVNGGAVHDIAVSADGTFAYGVAGDPDSLGMVFSYSAESGITLEGYLHYNQYEADKMFGVSCEPCSVAISPDGTRVAVGVRDQLGCVYEVEI